MNRWGPALVFGLLLTACAPETSITLEGQLRDRLKVKYGADFAGFFAFGYGFVTEVGRGFLAHGLFLSAPPIHGAGNRRR